MANKFYISKFKNPIPFYIEQDLKIILNALYSCYQKIISSEIFINNNENDIRDIFLSDLYLENHSIKQELNVVDFQFDKEIMVNDGRADIRVFSMPKKMNGLNKPYYYIECKRLDGIINPNNKSTLNDKYINEGIDRFIKEKYPTYLEANAMLGFIVNHFDIIENSKQFDFMTPHYFINNFEYSYISNHISISNKQITLYHLMLDFSSKIKPNL